LDSPVIQSASTQPAVSARPLRLSSERARAVALDSGFAEAGLVALPYAHQERDAMRYEEWVRAGRAGTMRYLERRDESGRLLRSQVQIPFPWARSVLVCWAGYDSAQPRSTDPAPPGAGWIARYAWSSRLDASGQRHPSDYHKVLLKRMKSVEARLHVELGAFEARAFVDTGPVAERALAEAAGLGWTGKNTCLIHPRRGSFGFLAMLVISVEREETQPATLQPDRCGSCRRCLEACPTGALIAPYQMDAMRCIAYLTIEHRGPIEPEQMEEMGRQVFGCDICQDVCPWNRKALIGGDSELEARPELVNPALELLAAMDEVEFERQFNGSPMRRAGFWGFRRNVAIAMGNSGLGRFAPWFARWAEAPDEGLRTAALWALDKLKHAK
jgi:epoxyqueuosine reductase